MIWKALAERDTDANPSTRGESGARVRRAHALGAWVGILMIVGHPGVASARAEHDFVGLAKCGTCHKKELIGNQIAAWRAGPHSRAFETLGDERSAAIASEHGIEGPASESADCLSCHATAFGLPSERMAYPVKMADGVQCESCHGPGRDYRKKKIMSDRDEALKKGLWEAGEDSAVCETCHNAKSPTFDPARYTLPDGSGVGFDFEQAKQRILHEIPPDVKGKYVELEEKAKAEERKNRRREP